MSVKNLGKIADGGSWKPTCRTAASILRDRNTKVGLGYVHSLVDDHSQLTYSETPPDEKRPICGAFVERAIVCVAAHGVTHFERLITDNAWAYLFSLREPCAAHRVRQKSITSHCPWQNCKAELFSRSLHTEWAYRQTFLTGADRTAALAPGSSTATPGDVTQPSEATFQSVDWHQREDVVDLAELPATDTAAV